MSFRRFFRIDRHSATRVRLTSLCLAALFSPAFAAAHTAPEAALQAQEMLGQDIWSRVVKLENSNEKSRYPSTLYATVFEFDKVLWFYTSTGTQPIELSRNRVSNFQEDLLPLLKTIEDGFSSATIVPPGRRVSDDFPQLENGCVIESIFTIDQLRRQGEEVQKAQLLLYSTKGQNRLGASASPRGHAVLIFETPEGRFFVDPPEIEVVKPLETEGQWRPATFATAIESEYGEVEIGEAFFVPVDQAEIPDPEKEQLYSGER